MEFEGRAADLGLLESQLRWVAGGSGATRGRAVIMTGRRRVGKSRLVQEFCDRSGVPYVLFQATRGRNPVAERAEFTALLAQSDLRGADTVAGLQAGDWNQALRAVALALPDDAPAAAVLGEVPRLVEHDRQVEGGLRTAAGR